jgi:hypothetical protein
MAGSRRNPRLKREMFARSAHSTNVFAPVPAGVGRGRGYAALVRRNEMEYGYPKIPGPRTKMDSDAGRSKSTREEQAARAKDEQMELHTTASWHVD